MYGDDASHCCNGLTATKFRLSTAEERAVYRRWMRGAVALYGGLLLVTGILAVASYSSPGVSQLTKLSTHPTAVSARTD